MIKRFFVLILVFVLLLSACATPMKSTLLGVGIGATVGSLLGSAIRQNSGDEDRGKATLIGGAVGAAAGGLVGYYGHQQQLEKEKLKDLKLPPEGFSQQKRPVPSLTVPEVRRVWVPDKIEDNKYEEGHYIYVIERQSVWSK